MARYMACSFEQHQPRFICSNAFEGSLEPCSAGTHLELLELLSPCFPSNSNVEDVRHDPDGNATTAKIIPYGDSIQELILPEAKDRFGSYNAFTDEPPVRKELKPLLKGFLSQPMDLDEPFPLSVPADPAAAASTESTVTDSGVRVKEGGMSASIVIDLDEPSAKKTKEGDTQDMKILTAEEETAAMMAADGKMPTLSHQLDQLIELCDDDANELKNLAETKN
eukprot:6490677-Amphidinium_carterae.3